MLGKDFIYVGGVPGAGKTTLCNELSKKLQNIIYISSGEIKRPESIRRYEIGLSQLDQDKSFEINEWFFRQLFERNSNGIYLVDTHYTYSPVNPIFVNLCPESVAENIGLYILLETNFEDIVRRRVFRGRERDSIDLDFTKLEIKVERDEAIRLSKKFKTPLIILKNEGDLISSSRNFSNILQV